MIVLEREDRARRRARIYATIGHGSTCDAPPRADGPDGTQIVRAMQLAIERSGRALEETAA